MKISYLLCLVVLTGFLAGCASDREATELRAQAKVSQADAAKIALNKVPGGTIKEGDIEKEDGKLIWSFDIATAGTKDRTEVAVDAMTGEVIAVEKETPAKEAKEKDDGSKGSEASKGAKALPAFAHPREITNPFLPLASLKQDILEGKEGAKKVRIERTAKPDMHKTFKLGTQTIEALAVEDREFEDGALAEVTVDFFAQADDGTVYYLGETVDEYKNGKVVGHSGAWMYGVDTKTPGVLMPAHPKIGETFQSENVPKITRENDEVLSLSETVTVPAGIYENCLKIKENLSDDTVEYKYYAPGIGCVKEVVLDGEVPLQSHTTTLGARQTGNQMAWPVSPASAPRHLPQEASMKNHRHRAPALVSPEDRP
jgi:hypothetical protein